MKTKYKNNSPFNAVLDFAEHCVQLWEVYEIVFWETFLHSSSTVYDRDRSEIKEILPAGKYHFLWEVLPPGSTSLCSLLEVLLIPVYDTKSYKVASICWSVLNVRVKRIFFFGFSSTLTPVEYTFSPSDKFSNTFKRRKILWTLIFLRKY